MRISDWSSDVCSSDLDRLVQRDVDVPALAFGGASGAQGLAVDLDLVAIADLGADPRTLAVDGDPPLPDKPVGLAPGAEAGVADVLVESHPDRGVAGGRAVWQICPEIGRAHVLLQSLMRIQYDVFCLKKKIR